jgi:hypothetical protein
MTKMRYFCRGNSNGTCLHASLLFSSAFYLARASTNFLKKRAIGTKDLHRFGRDNKKCKPAFLSMKLERGPSEESAVKLAI